MTEQERPYLAFRQIEAKALSKMRKPSCSSKLKDYIVLAIKRIKEAHLPLFRNNDKGGIYGRQENYRGIL